MAQHYNISIEDVQRIYSVDGQSVRFVVGDINNGGNGTQPIIYTVPQNSQPALFSHQTINLATPLDQRQSVFIIKSDPPATQNIIKTGTLVAENVSIVEETKVSSNIQEAQQSQWISVPDPKIDFVPKQTVQVKQQAKQQNVSTILVQTPSSCAQTDLQVYSSMEKKSPRLYRNKAKLQGGNQGISSASSPGIAPRLSSGDHVINPTARISQSGLLRTKLPLSNDASQLSRGIRAINACSPMPRTSTPILSRAVGQNSLNSSDFDQLSERIKREKLKQIQIKQQDQQDRQVLYARTPQKSPIITQRPIPTLRTSPFLQRQTTPRLQSSGQMAVQRPIQSRIVTPNQQQGMNSVRLDQRRIVMSQSQQSTPRKAVITPQRSGSTTSVQNESNMQVVVPETTEIQEKGRMIQQSCTPKSDTESSSSESYAYLKRVIENPQTAIVQQHIEGNVAKMLVVLLDGEQRLITFDIPSEDCTVQDLLEQVSIPFDAENIVYLVNDPTLGINYIVEVQVSDANEQNDGRSGLQESTRNIGRSNSPSNSLPFDENSNSSTSQMEEPKYVDGKLAVCPYCGIMSSTFNQCERCKRKLPENVKSVPDSIAFKGTKEHTIPCDSFYKKVDHSLIKTDKLEKESTSIRGRGRGRGGIRTSKKPVKEPECLIISSDEEHDNEKSGKHNELTSRTYFGNQEGMNSEESEMILEKEPIITNQSATATEGIKVGNRESDDLIADCPTNSMHVSLLCRTVRIGSYKYIPEEDVIVSKSGLRLNVPFLEDSKKLVTVDIKFVDIIRVLIHFGRAMPVLFFYTSTNTGAMIREVLGMQDPKGPYYDPASRDHTHKRITLLPEMISDESKAILKSLYEEKLEELNPKEANDILVRASPKDCLQQVFSRRLSNQTGSTSNANTNGIIQTITVYPPPPAKGGIAINTEDYLCLGEDQFLNDVIIDFYLKYLTSEVLSEVDRNRTHVFSSYFYKRLTSPHASAAMDSNMPQTAAGKRHARVQKWTKNVNIFEKDFIVIPINEHAHWFLAIICFPGLVGKVVANSPTVKENEAHKNLHKSKRLKEMKLQAVTIGSTTITPVTTTITIDQADDGSERDEAEGDDDEMEMEMDSEDEEDEESSPSKKPIVVPSQPAPEKIERIPCILIFDSLAGASRARVVATLRDYLFCEHIAKEGSEKTFSRDTIKGAIPKVPQQSNFTDCGVYVLQYVESFFKDPIKDYTLPIKSLKIWFEEIVVTRKREELSKLLIELMKKSTKADRTINLPNVSFPTQDGKLKPKPESEKTSKSEEGKKKAEPESKTSAASSTESTETQDQVIKEVTSKNIPIIPYSSTSSSSCSSTEGNPSEMSTDPVTPVRSSTETMNYLKSKRIQRIVMKNDSSDEKPAAKKLKSDVDDSCK